MIGIIKDIYVTEQELVFKASRSSGPGGQNVNKLNTRITLYFNITDSENFSDSQKKLIFKKLSTRIDKDGCIRIVSQKYRTQKANRNAAIEKFRNLLADALKTNLIRKKTQATYASKLKRLDEKKRRSRLKQIRADKNYDF